MHPVLFDGAGQLLEKFEGKQVKWSSASVRRTSAKQREWAHAKGEAAVFASRTAPSWWQHASVYCASTNAALTRALPFELRSSALLPVG